MISRFWKSRDGSVLPLFGLACFVLIGAMGFGVDAARLMLMHSSLQRSIDAGALSAVSKLGTTDLETELRNFTQANFSEGQIGARLDTLTWTMSNNDKTLTVNARATAPTTFMTILGVDTMSTSAMSVVDRKTSGLELALILDNTGSMSKDIGTLKTAATDLLDILFGGEEIGEKLYVGIVPFSQSVNIGPSRSSWLKPKSLDAYDWGKQGWGGCVEGLSESSDVSDDLPSEMMPYYYRSSSTQKTNKNPNDSCPAEVTPLTPKKATLVSAIGKMKAVGWTHINLGAVWGWRMLSPKWRGEWGGEMASYQLPLDYRTQDMQKVAVIMTDGDNTKQSGYTAYGFGSGTLGWNPERELNRRLSSVCTSMKNNGILVFTIAFNNVLEDTRELLENCASGSARFFISRTKADLEMAFRDIGNALSNLRVSR